MAGNGKTKVKVSAKGGVSRFSPFHAAHFVQGQNKGIKDRKHRTAALVEMRRFAKDRGVKSHAKGSVRIMTGSSGDITRQLKPLSKLVRNSRRKGKFKVAL